MKKQVPIPATPTGASFSTSIAMKALFVLLMISLCCTGPVKAQSPVIISASGIEHSIGAFPAAYSDDVVVNCDMLEYHSVDPMTNQPVDGVLKAIAYGRHFWGPGSGAQPTGSYLYLEDNMGNTTTIQLEDSACNPDVVLGEVVTASGGGGTTVTYYAVVVYDTMSFYWDPARLALTPPQYFPLYSARKPRIAIYQLSNVGMPGFGAGIVSGYPAPLSPSTSLLTPSGSSPHIDMWSDATSLNPYSGLPSMHRFGICWTEDTLDAELYVAVGDLLTGTPPSPIATTFKPCTSPDIAVLTEHTAGSSTYTRRMYIAYANKNAYAALPTNYDRLKLRVMEYTPGIGITQNVTYEDSVGVYAPRIEAMSQHDPSANPLPIKWEVAANVQPIRFQPIIGGIPYPTQPFPAPHSWHVAAYNDRTVAVPQSFSYVSPMGTSQTPISYDLFDSTSDVKSACIAAGISAGLNSKIGNNQYTLGYFPWATTTRYARAVDAITGGLVAPTDHYEINNAGNPVNWPWDADKSMALSNCSNSGQDIFSAWYNGTDIVYKHSNPNIMAFRQSHATAAGTLNGAKASGIYPNPANWELHIDGRATGSAYQISDITGKRLLNGRLNNDGILDVSGLASGLFLIQVAGKDGIMESFKFTKN